jgi:hypothetical protein
MKLSGNTMFITSGSGESSVPIQTRLQDFVNVIFVASRKILTTSSGASIIASCPHWIARIIQAGSSCNFS